MQINLPSAIDDCIHRLLSAGYSAYAVGGCVRDSLLGNTPCDWDVCTCAKPDEVTQVFKGMKIIETGIAHGTVTLLTGGMAAEITTMRRDGEYLDHRRPSGVEFTASLHEDLSRRDFTVNAIAYNGIDGLCDPFGGKQDLARGLLRCVGDPDARFSEDALRILRLFRFVSQLTFVPDPAAIAAAQRGAGLLRAVSAERIQAELNRILTGAGVYDALCLAADNGILTAAIPEFSPCIGLDQKSPYHNRTVDRHTFCAIASAPPRLEVRLALLLHDIGKPEARTIDDDGRAHYKNHAQISGGIAADTLKNLRYSNKTAKKVITLIELHSKKIPETKPALRKLLAGFGPELVMDLIDLKEADDSAKSYAAPPEKYPGLRAAVSGIIHDGDCLSVSDLAIGGADLLSAGVQKGPEVGQTLKNLLELVLENPLLNRRDLLLQTAKAMKAKI